MSLTTSCETGAIIPAEDLRSQSQNTTFGLKRSLHDKVVERQDVIGWAFPSDRTTSRRRLNPGTEGHSCFPEQPNCTTCSRALQIGVTGWQQDSRMKSVTVVEFQKSSGSQEPLQCHCSVSMLSNPYNSKSQPEQVKGKKTGSPTLPNPLQKRKEAAKNYVPFFPFETANYVDASVNSFCEGLEKDSYGWEAR